MITNVTFSGIYVVLFIYRIIYSSYFFIITINKIFNDTSIAHNLVTESMECASNTVPASEFSYWDLAIQHGSPPAKLLFHTADCVH